MKKEVSRLVEIVAPHLNEEEVNEVSDLLDAILVKTFDIDNRVISTHHGGAGIVVGFSDGNLLVCDLKTDQIVELPARLCRLIVPGDISVGDKVEVRGKYCGPVVAVGDVIVLQNEKSSRTVQGRVEELTAWDYE